jgi:hypothetical protein
VMPFLKEMAIIYPDYNFCGVRFAGPCRQAFHVFTEVRQRQEIATIIDSLRGKATIAGALLMFGFIEGQFPKSVKDLELNIDDLIIVLRSETENKWLPIILGRYEENGRAVECMQFHKYDEKIIKTIEGMPFLIGNLALTPHRPIPKEYYCDNHHYNIDGYRLWSKDAAEQIRKNHFDFWRK